MSAQGETVRMTFEELAVLRSVFVKPDEVVVSRTDLEAACEFADVEHWNMAPGQRRVFDRLRAVLEGDAA